MEDTIQEVNKSKNIRVALIVIFILIFGGIILFLFKNLEEPTQYQGGKMGGKAAPQVALMSMVDGKTYTLSDLKGKTIFVNFFNTWCIPCNEEEPVLEKFVEDNKSDPNFVFISIARQDSKDNIKSWISETKPTQDVVFDEGEISLAFGVTGQPETFSINPDGIISGTLLARASEKSLYDMLEASK